MTSSDAAGSDRTQLSREDLEAELIQLRAALAGAGADVDQAVGEITAAREETRRVPNGAADAALNHERQVEAGRAELAGSEELNATLRRANTALAESEDRYRAM